MAAKNTSQKKLTQLQTFASPGSYWHVFESLVESKITERAILEHASEGTLDALFEVPAGVFDEANLEWERPTLTNTKTVSIEDIVQLVGDKPTPMEQPAVLLDKPTISRKLSDVIRNFGARAPRPFFMKNSVSSTYQVHAR